MTQSSLIWEKWKNKNYSGVSTYSLMKQPEFLQNIGQKAFIETMIVRIRRITGFRKFKHTVDLGCATGDWSYKYLEFSGKVTGIDLNTSFIKEASKKKRAPARILKILLFCSLIFLITITIQMPISCAAEQF